MKTLSFLIAVAFAHSVLPFHIKAIRQEKTEPTLMSLKRKVAEIDKYEHQHRKEIITLLSIEGKKQLIKAKSEDWPDNTEYIYHILKDGSGKIILTEQIPYSQSGDWYEEFKHYYNNDGKVFAFGKRETVFDESVKDGLAVQSLLKYYDARFQLITQLNELTDMHGKPIKRKVSEFNFRDDKYRIYKNVNDCLTAYHIKL